MGSGTTGIAALKSNRQFVGFDTSEDYIALAEKRINPYRNIINFGKKTAENIVYKQ